LCQLDKNTENRDPNLLVGFDMSDDAGVYRISEDMALVQTVDFFTPIVDDPFMYGQIAAANSLSDIYAMGGKPMTALSIACFSCALDPRILAEILKGGENKIKESGTLLIGGHTVSDNEIKYGLAVTGTVHPSKVVTNAGARPGDILILTKAIGTGILTTAFKFDMVGEDELAEAVASMATLNKAASEAMQKIGVNACTDITGFGLLGHAIELASASGVLLNIDCSNVPLMKNVLRLIEEEAIPGGAFANKRYFKDRISFSEEIHEKYRIAFFDPQTSGGLLISVPEDRSDDLLRELQSAGVEIAAIIGTVCEKQADSGIDIVVGP